MPTPRSAEYGIPPHERPSRFTYRLWNNARQRSASAGLPFSITQDWVDQIVEAGVCQVSGLPFDFQRGSGRTRPFVPSLDQIEPGKGYTPENTQVVVSIYNLAKNNNTHADVVRLSLALSHPHAEHSHDT
jgi:hypothetical protein